MLKSEATLRALPSDLDDPLERMMTEDDKKAVKGSDSRGQDFCKNMLNEDLQISSDFCDLRLMARCQTSHLFVNWNCHTSFNMRAPFLFLRKDDPCCGWTHHKTIYDAQTFHRNIKHPEFLSIALDLVH